MKLFSSLLLLENVDKNGRLRDSSIHSKTAFMALEKVIAGDIGIFCKKIIKNQALKMI